VMNRNESGEHVIPFPPRIVEASVSCRLEIRGWNPWEPGQRL